MTHCISGCRKQDTAAQDNRTVLAILSLQSVSLNWWRIAPSCAIAFMGAVPLCVCAEVTQSVIFVFGPHQCEERSFRDSVASLLG